MYLLKLDKVLLDKVIVVKAEPTDAEAVAKQLKEEDLTEHRYQLWCELIQCLQREAGMLVRSCKGDGTKAWKVLNDHFRSGERPRIQQLLHALTNLKLMSSETVPAYLIRAEDLKLNLSEVGEVISDQMMCSVVLRGLPKDYESFVTVVNYGSTAKEFTALKIDLINFASDRKPENVQTAFFGGQTATGPKCFTCKKPGHFKVDCPDRRGGSSATCHKCKRPGHFSKDCRQNKKCTNCQKTGHLVATCYSPGGGASKVTPLTTAKIEAMRKDSHSSLVLQAQMRLNVSF
jgi:hypothetical protein